MKPSTSSRAIFFFCSARAALEHFDSDDRHVLFLSLLKLTPLALRWLEMRHHLFGEAAHHVERHLLVLTEVRGGEHLVDAELGIDREPVDHLVLAAEQEVGGELFHRLGARQRADDALVDDAGAAEDIVEALVIGVGQLGDVPALGLVRRRGTCRAAG